MALSRRSIMKAALGAGALSYLPLARTRSSRAAAPGNFLVFYSPNAWRRKYWGATANGSTMTMAPSLAALEPHKADITVIKGLCLKSTTKIATHQDIVRILTCRGAGAMGSDPGEDEQAYGPSIDHSISTALGLPPPLTLSLDKSLMQMSDPTNWMWRLSWRQDGTTASQDLALRNPPDIYSAIYQGLMPSGQPGEVDHRLKRGQSVLDLVKQDLTAMRPGLSAQDKGHLDVYEGSIREIERRLTQTTSCDPKAPAPADWLGTGDAVDQAKTNGDVLLDLIGQSFACGARRVATLQWGEGALGVNPARTTKDHHWVTHNLGGASPGGTDLDGNGKIDAEDAQQVCDRWYADRFLSCLDKFKALGILDDTVIVWCTETSEGHNQNNCTWLVAGGKNLGMNLGKVIEYPFTGEEGALMQARNTGRDPKNASIADLWVSVQKSLGVQQEGFGEPGMTKGGLKELYAG